MPGLHDEIRPCPVGHRAEALEVLFRRTEPALRPRLVIEALDDAARGQLDLSGLWVAWRRGKLVAALLSQGLAGSAAALWAPEVAPIWRRGPLAVALIRAVLADYRDRGFRIAQALVDSTSPRQASADLTRAGMPEVTVLTYLERPTAEPLAIAPEVPRFDWRDYSPATDAEFREVLRGTYHGSLDMPELEGARSLDDVLASHRAGGRFDPSRWQVGRLEGEPMASAVLLLAEPEGRDVWEVSYLGLTPEARGRGLGRAILARALELARPHAARLELAVDARNAPAEHLYRRTGFTPFDRRAVHFRMIDNRSQDDRIR
jgi:mycothiol synthase